MRQRTNWEPFEKGFTRTTPGRSAGPALRCTNTQPGERRGAVQVVPLNQTTPTAIRATAWSRAENVSGAPDPDYSLYLDLEFTDGTTLWGQAAFFTPGTHDWQRRQVTVVPTKPIKTVRVYVLLRGHTGTADFDEIELKELSGTGVFDGQPLAPPTLKPGQSAGWFVRDVASNGPLTPFGTPVLRQQVKGTGRATTLYYVERLPSGAEPFWWNDLLGGGPLGKGERANVVTCGEAGATGTLSRYPYACVSVGNQGRLLGVPPSLGPRVFRLGAHGGARLFYAAFDLCVPQGKSAEIAVVRANTDPTWGFRSATDTWRRLFPELAVRRAKAEGIWMPFTDPAIVKNAADFSFAYHEGDNSVESDHKAGILSFRYTEPMTWWMPMPPSEPRDYATALARLHRLAQSGTPEEKRLAQTVLHAGSHNESGQLNHEFRNEPWANGTVWILNSSRAHPTDSAGPAKAGLDGEYLDSLEGWADVLDFRPESLAASSAPPTFARESLRPTLPTWFSVWDDTKQLSVALHRQGKLLFANATPWRIHAFAPLLDIMGTEVNWLPSGKFVPEDDSLMALRRTLSLSRPYLLLQNCDLEAFGPYVERFFLDCLYWGIYPSFFSQDAATHPYWDNPRWYERDRPYFKKYLPTLKRLSAAGWEPVTHARTAPAVQVERFGKTFFTVRAKSDTATELRVDRTALGLTGTYHATECLSGKPLPVQPTPTQLRIPLRLTAHTTIALELTHA